MALIDSLPLDKAQHELDASNYNVRCTRRTRSTLFLCVLIVQAFVASLNALGASNVHRAGILASIVAGMRAVRVLAVSVLRAIQRKSLWATARAHCEASKRIFIGSLRLTLRSSTYAHPVLCVRVCVCVCVCVR
jgi:hypothetical protein